MRVKWSLEQDKLLAEKYNTNNKEELLQFFPGRTVAALTHRALKLGIVESGLRWTTEEDDLLKRFYSIKTNKELNKILNRSLDGIQGRAKNLGLKKEIGGGFTRSTSVNYSFFKDPNVLNAYWAGFIAADGCVLDNGSVSISLSTKDTNHLMRFMEDCSYTGRLSYESSRVTNIYGHKSHCGEKSKLSINGVSNTWIKDLYKNFSITPRKTFTLTPPNITNKEHILSYIVGYLDGDGCLYINNVKKNGVLVKKRLYANFLGTQELLVWIVDFLNMYIPSVYNSLVRNYGSIYTLSFSGKRLYKFIDISCSLDIPRLKRKWEPAVEFINSKGYNVNYNYYSL